MSYKVRIEDIARKISIGPFGSRMKSDSYTASGVPVIRGTNLSGGKSFTGQWVYISDEMANELESCCVYSGDLVFPHRGSIGEVGIVTGDFPRYMMSSSLMKLSCDTTRADPTFVYYFFKSNQGKHELLKNASQVGTPGIGQPLTTLKNIEIPLPPLANQKGIALILSNLDDKILLNRQTNQTLEQMAQALFKSWLVDYDPIHAKKEGRDTGLPPHIADLFPDEFVDSELGMIPKGWEVRSLDEIADFLNGLAMQKFPIENEEETLPVIKIAQLKKGDTEGADLASSNIKPEYIIYDGDVLFSWSGSLEVDIWCGGKGALNQHLFKVTSDNFPKWFYYYWTKHHLNQFQAIASGKAVTMGHIQRKHLTEAKCIVPDKRVFNLLGSQISNVLDQQITLRLQVNSLVEIRDSLLPKLLSGEITVGEVPQA
ncbi:restriction endonuclease subunit S [Leptospira bourretii]|uniref:Restriction endonuclease subunit S n=1 Tax=Leptospira bourretii TaxID=2484962 RepID=A0A4R9IIA7_9LEPT|nr:restriction endonuclease subunit S [Leptospira bourretii]TGK88240.1 restriction endonuclease subunit S [Leptospira bourretii]TGK88890.1 restriction endonuclease subunit S [Leptospira bourretii]TGL37940.1 restriction endonuclease subunit S [Leptospira bourretii]